MQSYHVEVPELFLFGSFLRRVQVASPDYTALRVLLGGSFLRQNSHTGINIFARRGKILGLILHSQPALPSFIVDTEVENFATRPVLGNLLADAR